MIQELLDGFKDYYTRYGDKCILDQKKLKEGLYIRVNKDFSLELILINKKKNVSIIDTNGDEIEDIGEIESKGKDGSWIENQLVTSNNLYQWFLIRNYYSSIIDTNKCIDPSSMKIHSNNYLSFFTKKEAYTMNNPSYNSIDFSNQDWIDKQNIVGKTSKNIIFDKVVKDHYNKLRNQNIPQNTLSIMQNTNSPLYTQFNDITQVIANNETFIQNNMLDFVNLSTKLNFSGYIGIYFNTELNEYKNEYKKYIIPRIFNKNDYNILFNGMLYGLGNLNINDNIQKKFIRNLTTSFKVCNKISLEDAYLLNKFSEWLFSLTKMSNYINVTTFIEEKPKANNKYYFLKIDRRNGVILNYELIHYYRENTIFKMHNPLKLTDKDKDKNLIGSNTVNSSHEIYEEINETFFNKRLEYNDLKINSSCSAQLTVLVNKYRDTLYDYFIKKQKFNIKELIQNVSNECIKQHIKFSSWYKISQALNLHWSLQDHFDKTNVCDEIENFISNIDITHLSNKQFMFIIGQLIKIVQIKNKIKDGHKILNEFICLNDSKQIQDKFINFYKKYSHSMDLNDREFNGYLTYVSSFKNISIKKEMDFLLAGYFMNFNYDHIFKKIKEKIVDGEL